LVKLIQKVPYWVFGIALFICIGWYCSLGKIELAILATVVAIVVAVYLLLFKRQFLFQANLLFLPLALEIPIAYGGAINYPSEFIILSTFLITFPFFLYHIKDYRDILKHPIAQILIIQVVWMITTSLLSDMPLIGVKRSIIRLVYIYIYFIITLKYIRLDPSKGTRYFMLYAIGLLIPIIVSISFMASFNFSMAASYMAGYPFYKDHTIYGAAVAFIAAFLIFIAMQNRKLKLMKTSTILLILFAAFIFIALFFSYSRAAWISFVAGIVYALALWMKIKLKQMYLVLFLAFIVVAFNWSSIYGLMRKNDSISSKDGVQEHIESVTNLNKDASNLERINRWVCAIRMFKDKPIQGFGPGTYQFKYGEYQTQEYMTRISTFRGNRGHAHSEYLGTLAEQGIIGLLILLASVHIILSTGNRIYYDPKVSLKDKALILALMIAMITVFIHSLFNGFMETDKVAGLVFISCAMLVGIDLKYKRSQFTPPLVL
jgi:putative inorganic carbon (HCO3(-)) transporter